ncbi:MAG: glycosyltransferase family 4 protein [Bacteroidetes bacterium]|nr:glycosyltransferase family 4 protein [Bacteroidota bacterium]
MKKTSSNDVLYLSIDGMTDPLGQSQVLPYLVGVSKAGYSISIVSCEKPERFQKNKDIIVEICQTAGINWHPIEYKSNIPLLSSLSNIRNMQKKAEVLHRQEQFDMVHCRSYLPMFTGVQLKKRFGAKLLFDIRGFWPDERVDGGLWDLSNPIWKSIYKYFKRKEKQFFKTADHIISLTNNAKKEIQSWELKETPISITVIPCCADLELFNFASIDEKEKLHLLKELDLKQSDYIITYLGSLGTFYSIEDMLSFYKVLIEKEPTAIFLIITASSPDIVWEAAESMGINKNSIRVVKASREQVPLYLSLGNFSLVFYRENYSRKACSPTKIGELMGMGIPFVCSPNVGDSNVIIAQTGTGYSLNSLTLSEYNAAINFMEENLSSNKEKIRNTAFKLFDLEYGIVQYKKVYQTLLSE